MAARLGSCPACGATLPKRSNYWVSAIDGAERVCFGCQSWARRTLTALHRQKMLRVLFP